MPGTLAFAPTRADLDDDLFTVPVLTFAGRPFAAACRAPLSTARPDPAPAPPARAEERG